MEDRHEQQSAEREPLEAAELVAPVSPRRAGEPGPEHEQSGGQRQQTRGVDLVEQSPRQGQQRKAAYPAWPHLAALRVGTLRRQGQRKIPDRTGRFESTIIRPLR
jgi:hypothetical protein